MRVFLSYRRSDVGGYAGRLHDSLLQRLGAHGVFHDVSGISPGASFVALIDRELDRCDAVLVVIGPGWASAATAEGDIRLQQPSDFVRKEVARALQRDIAVVPVLVGGAVLPTPDELPDDVREIAGRQAVVLHDATWREDVEGLVRSLRGEVATTVPRHRRTMVTVGVAATVVVVAAASIAVWRRSAAPGDDDAATLDPCPSASGPAWQGVELDGRPGGQIPADGGSLTFEVRTMDGRDLAPGQWQVVLETGMENDTDRDQSVGDWHYDSIVVGGRAFRATCFTADAESVIPATWAVATVGFVVDCAPSGQMELVLEDRLDRIDLTGEEEPSSC